MSHYSCMAAGFTRCQIVAAPFWPSICPSVASADAYLACRNPAFVFTALRAVPHQVANLLGSREQRGMNQGSACRTFSLLAMTTCCFVPSFIPMISKRPESSKCLVSYVVRRSHHATGTLFLLAFNFFDSLHPDPLLLSFDICATLRSAKGDQ